MELRTFPTYVRAYILDSLKAMGLDCTRTDNTVVLTIRKAILFFVTLVFILMVVGWRFCPQICQGALR
jgi:hypothetical protein